MPAEARSALAMAVRAMPTEVTHMPAEARSDLITAVRAIPSEVTHMLAILMPAEAIAMSVNFLIVRHPTLHNNIWVPSKHFSIKRAVNHKTTTTMVTWQWKMPATSGTPDTSLMVLSDLGSEAATCRHTTPATTSTESINRPSLRSKARQVRNASAPRS